MIDAASGKVQAEPVVFIDHTLLGTGKGLGGAGAFLVRMPLLKCMIAWTPTNPDKPGLRLSSTAGRVKVGPWPDKIGWSTAYALTGGACHSSYHSMPQWQRIAMLFIEFHTLVVRDEIDPKVAHEAFLVIDEYRQKIALEHRTQRRTREVPA